MKRARPDEEDEEGAETMEDTLNELGFLSNRGGDAGTGAGGDAYSDEERHARELMESAAHYWVPSDPHSVFRLAGFRDVPRSIRPTHAILYFAWHHLFWRAPRTPRVMPLSRLAQLVIHNLESCAQVLRAAVDTHTVVFDALIAMARGKGALRFCMLAADGPPPPGTSAMHRSRSALLGDGLGVYFDPETGMHIYDALYRRRADVNGTYVEHLLPIHTACFQEMVAREAAALFKRTEDITAAAAGANGTEE